MTNIILEGSEILSSKQDIRISDNIIFENANAQTPYSDRPLFLPQIRAGSSLVDLNTGTEATTVISGTRYGIVNQAVTQFVANQPPIEDIQFNGGSRALRGCPAFTQLCKQSETLTNVAWSYIGMVIPIMAWGIFQGKNIWLISENTATNPHVPPYQSGAFSAAADNAVLGYSFIYKPNGRDLQLMMFDKAGAYNILCNVSGSSVTNISAGAFTSVTAETDGYFRVFVAAPCGTGANTPGLYMNLLNAGASHYTGDGVSGVYVGQPIYINFGVAGVPFIPPYVPNNTSGSISVVSEAATATNGTSFDLDDIKLARLKNVLRGVASGNNLWELPVIFFSGWSDDGINYVSAGGNDTWPIKSATTVVPAQMIEISFRTGDVASGNLNVYVSNTAYTITGVTPDTAYTVRAPGDGTNRQISFTSKVFTGKIIKDSIKIQPVYAQGHLELEFVSNVDSGWLSLNSHTNILSAHNTTLSVLYITKDGIGNLFCRCYDGTNLAAVLIPTITVGQIFKISLDWGTHSTGQKMRITVNGVKSALANFSGSFGSQDLRFFFGNTVHAGWIKKDSLKVFDKPIW